MIVTTRRRRITAYVTSCLLRAMPRSPPSRRMAMRWPPISTGRGGELIPPCSLTPVAAVPSLNNNWTNGGDWAYSSNKYQGQHTGADSRRYLTIKNSQPLNTYPSGTMIEVSWDQSVAGLSDIFSDGCTNLDTNWNHSSPTAWAESSNIFIRRVPPPVRMTRPDSLP